MIVRVLRKVVATAVYHGQLYVVKLAHNLGFQFDARMMWVAIVADQLDVVAYFSEVVKIPWVQGTHLLQLPEGFVFIEADRSGTWPSVGELRAVSVPRQLRESGGAALGSGRVTKTQCILQ
jgi:hypothetical protein